jgi:hypothetical protein
MILVRENKGAQPKCEVGFKVGETLHSASYCLRLSTRPLFCVISVSYVIFIVYYKLPVNELAFSDKLCFC